tara:strand:- start:76 stop:279 length:204 start_codon:yes stop_codon:yes gene_type:complete
MILPHLQFSLLVLFNIAVAIAVFYFAYQKYFNSPLNKELAEKKKALINGKKELNERLKKTEQDLKKL